MRPTLLAVAVLAAALCSRTMSAADPPKRSPELQVLDRFVGTWDFVVINQLIGGETVTGKTSETRTWTLGGKFVQWQNPKTEKPDEPEVQMLVTYDPATKTYPGVLMNSTSPALVTGTWDESKQTMTFSGTFADSSGNKFSFTNRFTDNDHCEAAGTIRDAVGKVFLEQTQKQTRRKK